ncbi:MAG: hypothetical protein E6288_03255 [Enterobacteriaceae bacterium]|nr:hypothetical protein [Enterobacteriaceae bacterium]
MTTQLPSREDVNNALFRLTTPLRGIIEKDSTALMDKVALEKIAAHLTQITNAYCALLAAHEQEPSATVFKSGDSAKVIMIGADLADGYTDLFAHPAPVHAVPDERDENVDADDHPLLWSFNEGWNACRTAMLNGGKS